MYPRRIKVPLQVEEYFAFVTVSIIAFFYNNNLTITEKLSDHAIHKKLVNITAQGYS